MAVDIKLRITLGTHKSIELTVDEVFDLYGQLKRIVCEQPPTYPTPVYPVYPVYPIGPVYTDQFFTTCSCNVDNES
jgi:hypothetical protein